MIQLSSIFEMLCYNSPHKYIQRKNSKLLERSDSMAAGKRSDSLIVLFVKYSLSVAGPNSSELSQPCEKKSKRKQTCNMRSLLVFMTIGFGYLPSLYTVYCTQVCLS